MKLIYLLVFVFCSIFSFGQKPATHAVSNSNLTEANVSDNISNLSIVQIATAVQLDWLISDDAFKGYCVVEKSIDGKKWKDIGIAFSGETTVNEYRYIDKSVTNSSTMYYRIRRISENGKITFSKVEVLNISATQHLLK